MAREACKGPDSTCQNARDIGSIDKDAQHSMPLCRIALSPGAAACSSAGLSASMVQHASAQANAMLDGTRVAPIDTEQGTYDIQQCIIATPAAVCCKQETCSALQHDSESLQVITHRVIIMSRVMLCGVPNCIVKGATSGTHKSGAEDMKLTSCKIVQWHVCYVCLAVEGQVKLLASIKQHAAQQQPSQAYMVYTCLNGAIVRKKTSGSHVSADEHTTAADGCS